MSRLVGGVALGAATAVGSTVPFAGPAQADAFRAKEFVPAKAGAGTAEKPAAAKPTAKKKTTAATARQRRAATAVAFAEQQIGDPYTWGGNGPGSWDCSGLAGGAWRKAGVKLPRTTTAIYGKVKKKVSYKGLEPGDLIFFYSGRSHVGVYVGQGYMVHAPSSGKRVQKVKLSTYYKKRFNGAVRPG